MRERLYDYCVRTGRQDLLREWDAEKNAGVSPSDLTQGSRVRAWWKCEKGHSWQAAIYSRTGGRSGCPYCAGLRPLAGENDLATCFPALAAQWHPERNNGLRPEDVAAGSNRRVWWRCDNGHEWLSFIKVRTRGCGCPICENRRIVPGENDLASTMPALSAQWNWERNGTLTPADVVSGTRRKVWWRCEKGHEWQAAVASRANGTGCPVCTGRRPEPGESDLATIRPDLAAQWDMVKNGALTPQQVTANSNRRVWWRCEREHSWQAQVSARTSRDCGCPYCAGRKGLPDSTIWRRSCRKLPRSGIRRSMAR